MGTALRGQVEDIVSVYVVQFVPKIGIHYNAIDPQTGVGVNVGILEDVEHGVIGNGSTVDSGSIFEQARILITSRQKAKGRMDGDINMLNSFFKGSKLIIFSWLQTPAPFVDGL